MPVDVKNLFNSEIPQKLSKNADAAKKIGGVYQMNITGAGSWTVDLSKDAPSCTEGTAGNASCTIEIAEPDFQILFANPKAEGMKLFFAGKLKVKGNQMQAMNLQKLFELK